MWYHIETGEYLNATRETLKAWLMALPEQTQIPLEQTILGGFSLGGAMALDVGLDLPMLGLICLSGYWHPDIPMSHPGPPKPVLMLHGRQDEVVPLPMAQQAHQELKNRQLAVDYHELDMAHEVTPSALALIQDFLSHLYA